jgi:hypothetical protein
MSRYSRDSYVRYAFATGCFDDHGAGSECEGQIQKFERSDRYHKPGRAHDAAEAYNFFRLVWSALKAIRNAWRLMLVKWRDRRMIWSPRTRSLTKPTNAC